MIREESITILNLVGLVLVLILLALLVRQLYSLPARRCGRVTATLLLLGA